MTDLLSKLQSVVHAGGVSEIKFAAAEPAVIKGYASTFGGAPDRGGDVVAAGAFADSLAQAKAAADMPAMLWAHDPAEVIGVWSVVKEDAKGLYVEGALNLQTQRGREAVALVKQGAVTGLSIGYRVAPGGREFRDDGVRVLKRLDLYEISLTPIPMNTNARLNGSKSLESARDLEALLVDAGLPRAAAKKLTAGGWPALEKQPEQAEVAALIRHVKDAAAELRKVKS